MLWFVLPKIQLFIQKNYLKTLSLLPSLFQVNFLFSVSHALLSVCLFFPIPLRFSAIHSLLLFLAPWQPTQHSDSCNIAALFHFCTFKGTTDSSTPLRSLCCPRFFWAHVPCFWGFLTFVVCSVTWKCCVDREG